jgi:hypothetical protein
MVLITTHSESMYNRSGFMPYGELHVGCRNGGMTVYSGDGMVRLFTGQELEK